LFNGVSPLMYRPALDHDINGALESLPSVWFKLNGWQFCGACFSRAVRFARFHPNHL
jgi:hypothetical protein